MIAVAAREDPNLSQNGYDVMSAGLIQQLAKRLERRLLSEWILAG